jgi:Protein of unknown function (DUF3433)
MQNQPGPAIKSVLLDYLNPIWPMTFLKSLRNNHWRVSLELMVLFMLQITVLFSTALMLAQDTSLTQPGISLALNNHHGGCAWILPLTRLRIGNRNSSNRYQYRNR